MTNFPGVPSLATSMRQVGRTVGAVKSAPVEEAAGRAFVVRALLSALIVCVAPAAAAQQPPDPCGMTTPEDGTASGVLVALGQWAEHAGGQTLVVVDCADASPIAARRFQFRVRTTPLASLTLDFVGGVEPESRVGILARSDYDQLGERVAQCLQSPGTGARPDPHPILDLQRQQRRVRVAVETDAGSVEVVLSGDQDGATLDCIDLILDDAHRAIGPVEPGWPWADPAQWGLFQTATDLPALVWVDGWPTGQRTPVRALPLRAGTHTVQWFDPATGQARTETVRIEPGVTTQMDVTMP